MDIEHQMGVDAMQKQQMLDMQGGYAADNYEYLKDLTDIVRDMPPHLQNTLWSLSSKVHQLTNITQTQARRWEFRVDIIIMRAKMSVPRWSRTIQYNNDLDQIKLMFMSAIQRSVGGFERKAQITRETVGKHEFVSKDQIPKTGLLGRVFGGKK